MADHRLGQARQRHRAERPGAGGAWHYLRQNRSQDARHVIVRCVAQLVLRLVMAHDRRGRHASRPREIADGHGVGATRCKQPRRLITDDR